MTSQCWMTCSPAEGASHTQYCVLYALMSIQVPPKKCTHWMQLHRYKFLPALLLSQQWELLIARILSAFISVEIHLWTCTKTQVLARKNKWNKAGKRYLLLMEVERWQHLSVDNSSRQLLWGLWYLESARKLTWLWCNWGKLGNMDQGNWTLWNHFYRGSGDLLTGVFEQLHSTCS